MLCFLEFYLVCLFSMFRYAMNMHLFEVAIPVLLHKSGVANSKTSRRETPRGFTASARLAPPRLAVKPSSQPWNPPASHETFWGFTVCNTTTCSLLFSCLCMQWKLFQICNTSVVAQTWYCKFTKNMLLVHMCVIICVCWHRCLLMRCKWIVEFAIPVLLHQHWYCKFKTRAFSYVYMHGHSFLN